MLTGHYYITIHVNEVIVLLWTTDNYDYIRLISTNCYNYFQVSRSQFLAQRPTMDTKQFIQPETY